MLLESGASGNIATARLQMMGDIGNRKIWNHGRMFTPAQLRNPTVVECQIVRIARCRALQLETNDLKHRMAIKGRSRNIDGQQTLILARARATNVGPQLCLGNIGFNQAIPLHADRQPDSGLLLAQGTGGDLQAGVQQGRVQQVAVARPPPTVAGPDPRPDQRPGKDGRVRGRPRRSATPTPPHRA